MAEPITRQEEAELPDFGSFREAWDYFQDKYTEDFIYTGKEDHGDATWHFCNLIIDQEAYRKGRKQLEAGIQTDAMSYLNSHQPVQIAETGDIHIVY